MLSYSAGGGEIVSLSWKEMLWTKWSQYCSPLQRLAPSGPMLSKKRQFRDNSVEFDVFKLPDNHHEFLLFLITVLPSSVSHLIDPGVSMVYAAEGMSLPSLPHAGHLEDDCLLTLQGVTGTALALSEREWKNLLACPSPTHFSDPSALTACSTAWCRIICRRNCWLSKPWKESQEREHLGLWMVIEIFFWIYYSKREKKFENWLIGTWFCPFPVTGTAFLASKLNHYPEPLKNQSSSIFFSWLVWLRSFSGKKYVYKIITLLKACKMLTMWILL